ncbi:hypothetical protein V3331_14735 [Gaopeijia maritima]|uniref:hypothetical protein n=1 Tax=Gaopeijia maritima TaxID=3119007 RepID=UPI0032476AC1
MRGHAMVAALAAVTCGCDGASDRSFSGTPLSTGDPLPLVAGPPVATLGGLEHDDEARFFEVVTDGVIVGDSLVVLLDVQARRLKAFDVAGRPRWQAGGEGGGPGEFDDQPWRLFSVNEGSVYVAIATGRANLYDAEGEVIAGVALPEWTGLFPQIYGALDGDPPVLVVGQGVLRYGETGRDTMRVLALPLESGAAVDTLLRLPGPEVIQVELDGGLATTTDADAGGLIAAARGGRIVTAGVDDSVRIRDGRGRIERTVALPEAPPLEALVIGDDGWIRLMHRYVRGEEGRRWSVLDPAAGQWSPEARHSGSILGFGRELLIGKRGGEFGETLVDVLPSGVR